MSGSSGSQRKFTQEVVEHRKAVSAWLPQTDVWALAYGSKISTLFVAGSGFTILMRVRQFFNLFSQQHFAGTVLPVVGLPCIGYVIAHDLFMERKLLSRFNSQKTRDSFCSTCFEMRGAVLQTAFGIVLPFFLSVLTCSAASISHRTFPVPDLRNFQKVFNMSRRVGVGFSSTLILLTFCNIVAGGYISQGMLDQHIFMRTSRKEDTLTEKEEIC